MQLLVVIRLYGLPVSPPQTKTEINRQFIVGEWRPADEPCYLTGYRFHADGLCENNIGFLTYIVSKGYFAHVPCSWCPNSGKIPDFLFGNRSILHNILHYHGNASSYQIIEDTLRMYDPAKSQWFDQQIRFLSPDTLILSFTDECDNPVSILFSRMEYTVSDQPLFDRMLFKYPMGIGHGGCFSIERDSTFISLDYKEVGAYFVGKMRPGEFERIEALFKKADLSRTEVYLDYEFYDKFEEPRLGWIPAGTNRMHAVWPMRTPYENKEFYWAYISTLYSSRLMYMEPIDPVAYFRSGLFDREGFFNWFRLKQNGLYLDLDYLEVFYLNILLGRAVNTNQDFEPRYQLEKREKNIAVTDGRYFRYTNAEGREETLDIGHNFVEVNELDTLFGVKDRWKKYYY